MKDQLEAADLALGGGTNAGDEEMSSTTGASGSSCDKVYLTLLFTLEVRLLLVAAVEA